jgi:hypothetical protein
MLMICWLICGPRVNREKGRETEIPGCNTKVELRRKKNRRRKTTSIRGTRPSHPK